MGEVNGTKSQAVESEVADWLKRGNELRELLQSERQEHLRRVHEIDRLLAEMPGGAPQPQTIASVTALPKVVAPATVARLEAKSLRDASVPELVRAVLAEHPKGLASAEIVAAVSGLRAKVDPNLIHAALYRASGIRKEGTRGEMRYFADPAAKRGT